MKVFYFSGYGRSGSTIIGDFLGDQLGLAHLGEVDRTPDLKRKAEGHYCSCGQDIADCPVWGALEGADDGYGSLIKALLHAYPGGIIDTSKRPRNLFALKRLSAGGVEVRVIILSRSWAATRASLLKSHTVDLRKGVPKARNYRALWISRANHFRRNVMSVVLCRVLGLPFVQVTLEDLLSAQDARARQDLEAFVGQDLDWAAPFGQGAHVIAGNRLRMSQTQQRLHLK